MHLPAIQRHQRFCLVALDSPVVMAEQLGLDLSVDSNHDVLSGFIDQLLSIYGQRATGILVEPEFGLPLWANHHPKAGLLLPLTTTTADPAQLPKISPEWGIEHIHNNYGVAVLELWYHPAEEQALAKKQLLAELYDFCLHQEIDLALILHIAPPANATSVQVQEAQFQALAELRNVCHLVMLDVPQDALSAATITTELDIPWLVTLTAPTYDQAKEDLRLSLENGAAGFIVGDALWKEAYRLRRKDVGLDVPAIQEFITKQSQDRLIELMRITMDQPAAG